MCKFYCFLQYISVLIEPFFDRSLGLRGGMTLSRGTSPGVGQRFWLFLSGLMLIFCVAAPPVSANVPQPPDYAWFQFAPEIPFQGVQLVGCSTPTCDRPTLLMQSGVCQVPGCLSGDPQLGVPHQFNCAAQTCLYTESPFGKAPAGRRFKLIVAADRLWASPPFTLEFERAGNTLAVTPDVSPLRPSRFELFGYAFGLTQAVELTVAVLFLMGRKLSPRAMLKPLGAIGVINLLTFPVVWLFFPALQPWQSDEAQVIGWLSLAIALLPSLFLASRSVVRLRTLGWVGLIWLLSLLLASILAVPLTYGNVTYSTGGLPAWITLPASELFAVVWEAWLIYRVGRPEGSIGQAVRLSFCMNLASLLMGLVCLPAIQQIG
jgi:hypothetical protein